ncbi:class I SAM-dependent methyltransferase [Paenibacillus xerothermodurans]|uniref:Methyltransferase domain-containing protein n=1 Tax=Paenibacillus xerothermodurans TaxID=1977292 RepID=A0A2W1NRB2_PAEXE|nr:methyltransferase domain-containing protein [Paenibacillus xerothermodurans]PZE20276.1 methyltransferase domain-containing protein [Paenibacillus xerothermodurans]
MSNLSTIVQEKLVFLNKFFRSPRQVGSITPSSKYLARAMVNSIPWERTQTAAELGAGTGAITEHIKTSAAGRAQILLFETEASLREQLARRYPEFSCHADACRIQSAMAQLGIAHLDAILSGLPFFNLPQTTRAELMQHIARSLKPGGHFVAFQYSLQMKPQLAELFDIEAIHFVPLNVPPAFVYVCRKRGGAQ